jgi:hypothetical protein
MAALEWSQFFFFHIFWFSLWMKKWVKQSRAELDSAHFLRAEWWAVSVEHWTWNVVLPADPTRQHVAAQLFLHTPIAWELREFSEKIRKKGGKNYKKNEIICKAKIEKIEWEDKKHFFRDLFLRWVGRF